MKMIIDKSKINKNEGYLEVQDEKHNKQVIQERILIVCTYLIQEKWGNVLDVSNAP